MSTLTPNSGLYSWLDTDILDVDEVNYNFTKVDGKLCTSEGVTTGRVCINGTQEPVVTVNWYYRIHPATVNSQTVKVIEMSASYSPSNVRCNNLKASTGLYYSGTLSVEFPFTITEMIDMSIHCAAANTMCWGANTSNNTIPMDLRVSGVNPFDGSGSPSYGFKFVVIGTDAETTYVDRYKQIYFRVKGVVTV